jgi:hypothetical protein
MGIFAFNTVNLILTEGEKADIARLAPTMPFRNLILSLNLERKAHIVATHLGMTQASYVQQIQHDCDVSIRDYLYSSEGKAPKPQRLAQYRQTFIRPTYTLFALRHATEGGTTQEWHHYNPEVQPSRVPMSPVIPDQPCLYPTEGVELERNPRECHAPTYITLEL